MHDLEESCGNPHLSSALNCIMQFMVRRGGAKWLFGFFILAFPLASNGTIYFVSKTGTPNGPGLSWATAFDHFTTALEWAQPEDTLFIGEGIYDLPLNERVFISKGIRMFGGFAGWEAMIDERLTGEHISVIRSVGYYSKIVLDSLYVPSVLDGFVFKGGNSYDYGSGNEPCFITTTECPGGIIYIRMSPENAWRDLIIRDCIFENNKAHFGGAIGIANYGGSKSVIQLLRCTFKNNTSRSKGGAIYYGSQASAHTAILVVDSCVIEDNFGWYDGGAGIYFETYGVDIDSIIIKNSRFEKNWCIGIGGSCIMLNNRNINSLQKLFINQCLFKNNKSDVPNKASWIGGSALRLRNGGNISECVFVGNTGYWSPVLAGYNMNIQNCLFANNHTIGGGDATILIVGESTDYGFKIFNNKFSNCTFANNTSDSIRPLIYRRYPFCNDTLVNCLMYGNSNTGSSPVVVDKWTDYFKLFVSGIGGDAHPNTFYYVDEDSSSTFSTDIDTWFLNDPLFVDTAAMDFRLKRCSPFLNIGLNEFASGQYDLNGNMRILEGNVDLGAYERLSFSPEIDFLPVTCAHEPNGMLVYEDQGITPPGNWTIQDTFGSIWENGQLNKGSYSAVLEDSEGCVREFQITLDGPDSIQAWFTIIGSSQSNPEGSIHIDSIKGGFPQYLIEWYDGNYEEEVTNLYPGFYSVHISDEWDCKLSLELEVPVITSLDPTVLPQEFEIRYLSNGYLFYRYHDSQNLGEKAPYNMVTMNGQIIYTGFALPGEHTLWIGYLPAGMYVLNVTIRGVIQSFPVVIAH